MEAQGGISSKAYKNASLEAFIYFYKAYSYKESILSASRRNAEFRTMLKILEQGKTKHAHYLESIVNPLEKHGLVNCDHVRGYCKVTDEGTKVVEKFNCAANMLDKVLKNINEFSMKTSVTEYIILEGVRRLRGFIHFHGPFKPTGNIHPFIEAFIRAKGEPSYFILQIASLYHPLVFLLTAEHIMKYRTDGYPTGKEIKEILEIYMKKYDIPKLTSPLRTLSSSGLIEKTKEKAEFSSLEVIEYYKENEYTLTDYARELARYTTLQILLSYNEKNLIFIF